MQLTDARIKIDLNNQGQPKNVNKATFQVRGTMLHCINSYYCTCTT